jgi:hypothetical protein
MSADEREDNKMGRDGFCRGPLEQSDQISKRYYGSVVPKRVRNWPRSNPLMDPSALKSK